MSHPLRLLIVFVSPDCESCQEAKPHIAAFERKHLLEITVVRITQDKSSESLCEGWIPKRTPAFCLKVDGEVVGKSDGGLDDIEAWVQGRLSMKRLEPLRSEEAA